MSEKPDSVPQIFAQERCAELQRELSACQLRERRLQAFLEFAAQGIIAVDHRGGIIMVNAKTEEMFGYSREELIGRSLEVLLPARFRHAHTGHRSEFFAHPRTRPMGLGLELSGLRKDGTEFPVEISLSHVEEAGVSVALGFITDITERKRQEEQLRHTQKLESLGVLAGGVAHDFNNLLTGIMGNASLALDAVDPSHPVRPFLEPIVSATQRAADLTRQLLAYAGKGRFVVTQVDVSAAIREITNLIVASIPKSVQLRLDLHEQLPAIEADANQIQQLAMNLIVNAAEAVGEDSKGGDVAVTTGVQYVDSDYARTLRSEGPIRPGRYVFLQVSDTGQGMDEETLARIFDPFFTTKFTGRGLGLSAVSGIVRGHRGAMEIHSVAGNGTSFKVLFPACERRVEESAHARRDASARGVVLVVDDEDVVRQTAKSALQRYGYAVVLAGDGESALETYREMADRISVVLLDMTMPGISGEEILDRLHSIRPDVRVVLTSGYHQNEAVRRFSGKGLAGFIQKPYTAAQLAEGIRAATAS